MANVGYATLSVIPSFQGFQSKLNSGVTGPITSTSSAAGDKAGKGFRSRFLSGVGKLAGPVAALGIATAAAKFFSGAVDEAREAQKATAQTEAVIKSTGGAANVTAKAVSDLAGAISLKTGIDDEAIQSGQNMLLTFTNIRNEAGKGNDIFNKATSILTDMSVAMGTDMKSQAIQLGKALNDPVKGISALSRVGVQFTKQQEKQITTLAESGDRMGAQKIILAELNKQFAGSAEAQATAGDRASVAWANLQEQVGTALLPILDKFLVFISAKVIPAIGDFVDWIQRLSGSGDGAGQMVARVQSALGGFGQMFGQIVATVQTFIGSVQVLWAKYGDIIQRYLLNTLRNAITVLRGVFQVIQGIFQVFTGILTGDWSKAWEGIKNIFGGAWKVIQGLARQALNLVTSIIRAALRALGGIFRGALDGIKKLIAGAWNAIKSATSQVWNGIKAVLRGVWNGIKALVRTYFNAYKAVVTGVWNAIRSATSTAWNTIKSVVSNVWSAMKSAVSNGLSSIKGSVVNVWSSIVSYLKGIPGSIAGIFDNIWNGITGGLRDAVNSALGLPLEFPGWDWPGPGGIGPKTLIPALAEGGIVRKPTLAVIGEAGPEAVVPLTAKHMKPLDPLPPAPSRDAGRPIHITVNNPIRERSSESIQRGIYDVAQLGLLDGREHREVVYA